MTNDKQKNPGSLSHRFILALATCLGAMFLVTGAEAANCTEKKRGADQKPGIKTTIKNKWNFTVPIKITRQEFPDENGNPKEEIVLEQYRSVQPGTETSELFFDYNTQVHVYFGVGRNDDSIATKCTYAVTGESFEGADTTWSWQGTCDRNDAQPDAIEIVCSKNWAMGKSRWHTTFSISPIPSQTPSSSEVFNGGPWRP